MTVKTDRLIKKCNEIKEKLEQSVIMNRYASITEITIANSVIDIIEVAKQILNELHEIQK